MDVFGMVLLVVGVLAISLGVVILLADDVARQKQEEEAKRKLVRRRKLEKTSK